MTAPDMARDALMDAADGAPIDQLLPEPDGPSAPGVFSEVQSFGTNPGALQMFKYVPSATPAGPAPLVVVLHGCSMTAQDYATASGWNSLADARQLYLVYPQQSTSNNQYGCFNWFLPGDYARDAGEAKSIMQMIDQMKKDHAIDGERVYASGLSAGGAMAVRLGVAYPDQLAGIAPMAGVPAGCADDPASGVSCMGGVDKSPAEWGDAARQAFSSYSGEYPTVALFHGTADALVAF
jgi:poly(hydroxyalkanoate) depolymerase family esterase